MNALSSREMLEVWESCYALPPASRPRALLAAVCPELPPEALGALRIGERDQRLLQLREWSFGPVLNCIADCPKCGERHEITLNAAELRAFAVAGEDRRERFDVCVMGFRIAFRLPTLDDLEFCQTSVDGRAARRLLFARCVLGAIREADDVPCPCSDLHDDVVAAIAEHMSEADPAGDIQLGMKCAACEHGWQMNFDIATFFWEELNAWALRLVGEIHALARAYGWTESEILALSPWRRQLYLALVEP